MPRSRKTQLDSGDEAEVFRSADYPAMFHLGNTTATRGQRWYKRLILVDLLVLLFGGFVGAFASLDHGRYRSTFAIVSAVVLSIGLTIRLYGRSRTDARNWFNGRAVAESVKSLTWLYMMRTPPYDGDDADFQFIDALVRIRQQAERLDSPERFDDESLRQITDRMKEVRTWPLERRRAFYLKNRLMDQMNWYLGKARTSARRANQWELGAILCQAASVATAIILTSNSMGGTNLVGVFAIGAAAITAWSQVSNHNELARSYPMAATELIELKEKDRFRTTEEGFEQTVREAEDAISREHKMWVTKRQR